MPSTCEPQIGTKALDKAVDAVVADAAENVSIAMKKMAVLTELLCGPRHCTPAPQGAAEQAVIGGVVGDIRAQASRINRLANEITGMVADIQRALGERPAAVRHKE